MILNKTTINTIGSSDILPSQYLCSLKDLLRQARGRNVVLYIRESSRNQEWRKNLRDQRRSVKNIVECLGCEVLKSFKAVVSGWDDDRMAFKLAVQFAKKHGAILVAESADRFLRSRDYRSDICPKRMPIRHEWEGLLVDAESVILATLLHPDTSPGSVRSYQTKRGIREKKAACGRPRNRKAGEFRDRKERLLRLVQKMRRRRHFSSYGFIACGLDLPKSTVKRWCDAAAA